MVKEEQNQSSEGRSGESQSVKGCPWCGQLSDREDEWGSLITHKTGCYWINIHGDPIGTVRVNNSEKEAWNTRAEDTAGVEQRIAELEEALSDLVCGTCNNRIGFTGDTTGRYSDWRKCGSCRTARAALALATKP